MTSALKLRLLPPQTISITTSRLAHVIREKLAGKMQSVDTEIIEQKRVCLSCSARIKSGEAFDEIKTRGTVPTQYRHSSFEACQAALSPFAVQHHYNAKY